MHKGSADRALVTDAVLPPSLWRNRDYLLLWGGQAISAVGSQASLLALPLLILAETGSPAQAGLLGGLRGLPYLLFGLPAGALVDRWDRKRVMVLCELGRAAAFISIPLAMLAGRLSAAHLYAVGFIEGTLVLFFALAETAALVRVVPPARLPQAISLSEATESASRLAGPPLGGLLFGIGRALPFVVDAASYAVSLLTVLCIRTRLQEGRITERRGAMRAEIGEGMRWIRQRPAQWLLMWLNGGLNLVFGGWTLLVIALAQRQGAGSVAIGLIFAGGGAGMVLGALLTPAAQRRFTVAQLVAGTPWYFTLIWALYPLAPNPLVLGIITAAAFFSLPLQFGTVASYRLLILPDALQGRVNSVLRLVGWGSQALGWVVMGALLERFGPVATVWITFVPAAGLALLATFSPSLRRVGRLADIAAAPSASRE